MQLGFQKGDAAGIRANRGRPQGHRSVTIPAGDAGEAAEKTSVQQRRIETRRREARHRCGARAATCGIRGKRPFVRDEYNRKRLISWTRRGGMCWVSSARKSNAPNRRTFSSKYSSVRGVEQHLPFERLVADLLQRDRWPRDVLGEVLLASGIGEPHGVVNAEPRVAPRQQVPRKLLRQEVLLPRLETAGSGRTDRVDKPT